MSDPIRAADVVARPTQWLWRNIIPRGKVCAIGGPPDQGKGLLWSLIAAQTSTTQFQNRLTGQRRLGQVLCSAPEDDWMEDIRPRLEAQGANLRNIHLWDFQIPDQHAELEHHLREKHIDLLIIDPWTSHLGAKISRYSDNVRLALDPLLATVRQTGTAVIVIDHVVKHLPPGSDPKMAFGGSGSGLLAAARIAYLFGADPEDPDSRILACVKSNNCERPRALGFNVDTTTIDPVGEVPFLTVGEQIPLGFDAGLLLRGPTRLGRPAVKRERAAQWLTDYLYAAGQPVRAGQVIEDGALHEFSAKTLRNAADDIEVIRDPSTGGRACTWALSPELIEMKRAQTHEAPDDFDDEVAKFLNDDDPPTTG